MRLQNILNIYQYTALVGEGKDHQSLLACWDECVLQIKNQILADHTTTRENLREKIKNYILNYLAVTPAVFSVDRDKLIEMLAEEIEDDLKKVKFNQRPPASVIAQQEREKIQEEPENQFIKFG